MSVYVDDARIPYGRMKMCHMVADTTDELLAMADAIGVRRKWIQKPGTYREHFDVCTAKRDAALKHGALLLSAHALAEFLWQRRPTQAQAPEGAHPSSRQERPADG